MEKEKLTNLLKETLECLDTYGKTPANVEWVGFAHPELDPRLDTMLSGWCTWEEFALFAVNVNYDDGFGINEIPKGLIVCGSDFWLERHEYDGSEWWEFKAKPRRPREHMTSLKVILGSERLLGPGEEGNNS